MTRGKKPIPTPDVEVLDAAGEQLAEQQMAVMRQTETDNQLVLSQHDAAVRAVATQVGYQLPADCTDPDLIQRDVAASLRRTFDGCIEVGRGLAVLKEACGHGNFLARLEVLRLDRKVAAKFMQAAVKFSNVSSTRHLAEAINNQTKLFELLVLDDDQVEELELTGQTGELKLDDIATMSVKELRAALREARADNQADKELLAERHQENSELREKLVRIKRLPPDEVASELTRETAEFVGEALIKLDTSVRSAFTALADHHATHGGGDFRHLMAGHVAELQHRLNELRETFNLRDLEGDGTPEWMKWAPDGADTDAPVAGH